MNYVHELINKAKKLDELLSVNYLEEKNLYKVDINMVFYREIKTPFKTALYGLGGTIEVACYDYIRKARGGLMIHVISDKTIEVV